MPEVALGILESVRGYDEGTARPPRARRPRKKLRVGDRVSTTIGASEWRGVVIEDRGNLGVGGRQIVRVRCENLGGIADDSTPEWPADSLRILRRANRRR